MRLSHLLTCAAFAVTVLGSCKKSSSAADLKEIETTFAISGNSAISENLTQDANELLNEAAFDKNIQGSGFAAPNNTSNTLSCATVTVTPANGFPKNIVIDFGVAGCSSQNGITRRGIINVTLTDSLRRPGSKATMTFSNYYVGGYKKEGTITWTNTSTTGTKSWNRVCVNGKITAPGGDYWLHEGTQNIVQTAGTSTPTVLTDDVFSITGNRKLTNSAGDTRTGTILSALQKKFSCDNIDQGIYQLQGPSHTAVINYGNGVCDNLATISIDGNPERTIVLR